MLNLQNNPYKNIIQIIAFVVVIAFSAEACLWACPVPRKITYGNHGVYTGGHTQQVESVLRPVRPIEDAMQQDLRTRDALDKMEGDVVGVGAREEMKPVSWIDGINYAIGRSDGEEIIFKADSGDFMKGLRKLLKEKDIKNGIILLVQKGTFTDATIGFFMTHQENPDFDKSFHTGRAQIETLMGTIVAGQPHVHVLLRLCEGGQKLLGGHLIETSNSDVEVKIIPITGFDAKRGIDRDTGVGHFITDQARDTPFVSGYEMFFTLEPGEEFPARLLKTLKEKGRGKARLRAAIGTFTSVEIQQEGQAKPTLIDSDDATDGLELLWATGEIAIEGGRVVYELTVGLMGHDDKYYSGRLIKGRVKDLVEGVVSNVSPEVAEYHGVRPYSDQEIQQLFLEGHTVRICAGQQSLIITLRIPRYGGYQRLYLDVFLENPSKHHIGYLDIFARDDNRTVFFEGRPSPVDLNEECLTEKAMLCLRQHGFEAEELHPRALSIKRVMVGLYIDPEFRKQYSRQRLDRLLIDSVLRIIWQYFGAQRVEIKIPFSDAPKYHAALIRYYRRLGFADKEGTADRMGPIMAMDLGGKFKNTKESHRFPDGSSPARQAGESGRGWVAALQPEPTGGVVAAEEPQRDHLRVMDEAM